MVKDANTVKSWRVTTNELKVGNSPRFFGELIPEAENWPHATRASYERAGHIEKVYVDPEELDELKETVAAREAEAAADVEEATPKRKVKKSTVKKRVVKKKGNADVGSEEANGSEEVLAEVPV